ncbi:MAG: DUF2183 domain-containing protein [bacterium]|nr:DUF2183 domain-containing protein [bacterium]
MSSLQSNDSVALYPTFGRQLEVGGPWSIGIHGAVFEPCDPNIRQRLLLEAMRQYLRADAAEMQGPLFRSRISGFLRRCQRGRKISIRIGAAVYELGKPSGRDGQFTGNVYLSPRQIEALRDSGDIVNGWLKYQLETEGDAPFYGSCQLISATGVSVISDIDDTIKHTCVFNRREMLNQTFLRELRCVEGMAARYRDWSSQSVTMHYVSSSPWQMFPYLAELWDQGEFPQGSVHLRAFGLVSSLVSRVFLPLRLPRKRVVLRSILQAFPERSFVLVGDSGEKDPEIYGKLAARHPKQIQSIFIRDLADKPMSIKRGEKAFGRIAPHVARCFRTVEELPARLV